VHLCGETHSKPDLWGNYEFSLNEKPSLSKNEGHMDAEFRSRCALGCARIAASLAGGLREHSVKIAPAKAADLSCQSHPSCRTALAAHA
jgi:hypothetical protein